jgi:hypothetical protein
MRRLIARLAALELLDRLVLLCAAFGAAGFGLIYAPLGLLFLAAVSGVLAAMIDRRTPPVVEPEAKP